MKFAQFRSGGSDIYVNPSNVVYIKEHGKDKTVLYLAALYLAAGQPVTIDENDENVETVRHTLEQTRANRRRAVAFSSRP